MHDLPVGCWKHSKLCDANLLQLYAPSFVDSSARARAISNNSYYWLRLLHHLIEKRVRMCAVFNRNKKMKNEESFAQNSPLTRFVDTRTAFTFRTKQQTNTKLNTAVVDTLDFHLTPIFISILIRCCKSSGR